MQALTYREVPPPPDLIGSVACIWFMKAPPGAWEWAPIVPDGRVEIVLNLADPFLHLSGRPIRQPARLLVGPTTRPMSIRPTGAIDLVGIRLRPGAARTFIRIPLGEIRDSTASLMDLGMRSLAQRQSRLGEARSMRVRYSLAVEAMRASRLERDPDPRVLGAALTIIKNRGAISIDNVARACGTSARTLERLFVSHAGIGPKMLARLERFHQVLGRVRQGGMGVLLASALDAGYYDQSHLLKDFREFVGLSPSLFFNRPGGEVSSAFVTPPAG